VLGNQKPPVLLQVEKLLWMALVAVAHGKATAWAALGQFIYQAPWTLQSKLLVKFAAVSLQVLPFFTSLQHLFLMGSVQPQTLKCRIPPNNGQEFCPFHWNSWIPGRFHRFWPESVEE
jgi:hypothetical protein